MCKRMNNACNIYLLDFMKSRLCAHKPFLRSVLNVNNYHVVLFFFQFHRCRHNMMSGPSNSRLEFFLENIIYFKSFSTRAACYCTLPYSKYFFRLCELLWDIYLRKGFFSTFISNAHTD